MGQGGRKGAQREPDSDNAPPGREELPPRISKKQGRRARGVMNVTGGAGQNRWLLAAYRGQLKKRRLAAGVHEHRGRRAAGARSGRTASGCPHVAGSHPAKRATGAATYNPPVPPPLHPPTHKARPWGPTATGCEETGARTGRNRSNRNAKKRNTCCKMMISRSIIRTTPIGRFLAGIVIDAGPLALATSTTTANARGAKHSHTSNQRTKPLDRQGLAENSAPR